MLKLYKLYKAAICKGLKNIGVNLKRFLHKPNEIQLLHCVGGGLKQQQQFFQLGEPPSRTAVHCISEFLVSRDYHDNGVFVARPVTNSSEKM